MKSKFILFSIITLLFGIQVFAQETISITADYAPNVLVKYNVLKSDNKTQDGLFQALYKKKIPVASGLYNHGKRVGMWHFFDKTGKLLQHFDYNKNTVVYEAPDDSASNYKYILDNKFTNRDTVTKPIRVGGRYFGYLPYLNLFRLPKEMLNAVDDVSSWPSVYIELLVSPLGRLAYYRVHVISAVYGERVLEVNINHLSEQDKTFVPATFNGTNVSSRIILLCTLSGGLRLVM